jgi:hypothetical protein
MSLSDVIDRQYRLLPNDLAGKPRKVIVRGVTVEGVEFVTPLIHFEGLGRPLALDANQRIEMARIARSTILADWVGAALVLQPVRDKGQERIRLQGLDEAGMLAVSNSQALPPATSSPVQSVGRRLMRLLGMAAVVTLLLAAVWYFENRANLDAILDVLMP